MRLYPNQRIKKKCGIGIATIQKIILKKFRKKTIFAVSKSVFMKKLLSVLLFGIILSFNANAQALGTDYRTALGFKFYPGSLSVKHFVQDNAAIEGLASFWNYGFRVTGLYEFHGDISGAPGLKWYAGPGAHIAFYNNKWGRRYIDEDKVAIGIDGVIGLDYKFNGAPINLSIDFQPSFNIIGYSYFYGWGGFGIRYTLK